MKTNRLQIAGVIQGPQGEPGKSAYQNAVDNGFVGTEQEWLDSLKGKTGEVGPQGEPGKSSYQYAVDNGFEGTEQEWLASLKGDPGEQGPMGPSTVNYNPETNNLEYDNKQDAGGDLIDVDSELKEYMLGVKPKIKESIINKGGAVLDTDSFGKYADRINSIPNNVHPAQTLPPQSTITAAAIDNGVQINWGYVDADGYIIVRKKDSKPVSSADGEIVYSGPHKDEGYVDTGAVRGNVYYYRIFPRNAVNQYQGIEDGSIVKVNYMDRSDQKLLKDLELGSEICFGTYKSNRIKWKIVDKQDVRDGYITVACNSNLGNKQYDAPENGSENRNPDELRATNGNNNWAVSNIRQYLNSDKPANEWYTNQHQYDNKPLYASEPGFLHGFDEYEKNIIVIKKNKTMRHPIDGGGYETVNDKMWLASSFGVGLSIDMAEESHTLEYFSTNESRIFLNNHWWLRSMNGPTSESRTLRCVYASGTLISGSAINNFYVRPFCLLPSLTYMLWSDSDNAYVFADDSQLNF